MTNSKYSKEFSPIVQHLYMYSYTKFIHKYIHTYSVLFAYQWIRGKRERRGRTREKRVFMTHLSNVYSEMNSIGNVLQTFTYKHVQRTHATLARPFRMRAIKRFSR